MKKTTFLIIIAFFLLIACTREIETGDWLKPGTKMTYGVDFKGKTYDFIVEITQLEPDLIYNWQMTDPVNIEGVMTVKQQALESSNIHRNYYFGGEYETSEETSGWFSRRTFSELLDPGYTMIQMGFGGDTLRVENKMSDKLTIEMNGKEKEIDIVHAETENGYAYWIVKSEKYPVIMKMHVDFNIDIKKIEY